MNRRKKELGYSNAYLARISGIPVSTVNKVLGGITKAPRRTTLLALGAALGADEKDHVEKAQKIHSQRHVKVDAPSESSQSINYLDLLKEPVLLQVEEPAPAYQPFSYTVGIGPGPYTLEDYLALPDDDRVELIDGYFYNMSAPNAIHQLIAGQSYRQLCDIIEKNNGSCVPFIAPTDVQVDMSDKTIVQPDVMVICRPMDLIRKIRIFGAPDFIMEVLSPSTRSKDMTIKLNKYYESGVREYWLVDPASQKVMVYDLERDNFIPYIYDFTDQIPIRIWDCKESLDFARIKNYIDPFLDL